MALNDLDPPLAYPIIAIAKHSVQPLLWATKQNQSNILLCSLQPMDVTGSYMSGLSIALEIRKAALVDRCCWEFGLFKLHGRVNARVYQLNVTPADKQSHNGTLGAIYGPHEHHGSEVTPLTRPPLDCAGIEAAFEYFCQKINLQHTGQRHFPI